MAALVEHLRARRRLARGQRGYALVAVLAINLLVFLLLTALVGLTLTTMKVAARAEESSRELRALEGTMDAAINQMRYEPHKFAGPCALEPPIERVRQLTYPQRDGTEIVVDVDDCEVGESSLNLTADQFRLTSERGYTGDIPWTAGPWADLGLDGATVADEQPNLVHRGNQPLRIDSSVTVMNGSAALRDPSSGTPALSVAGEYTQGRRGINGTDEEPCGILAQPTSPAQIIDFGGRGNPDCGEPVDIDPTLTEPQTPFSPENDNPFIPPGTCARAVVDLRPGYYDHAKVYELHRKINQSAPEAYSNCGQRKTFHFHPGIYYFDVDELTFDRPDSYFVFGRPQGWTPFLIEATDRYQDEVRHPSVVGQTDAVANTIVGVRNSPEARNNPQAQLCDPDQSGVTFVLSPRTSLQHKSGRFAMCPAFSPFEGQPPLPAIYQETSVPTGIDTQHDPLNRVWNCNPGNQSSTGRDIVEPPLVGTSFRTSQTTFDPLGLFAMPSGGCRNGRTLRVFLTPKNPEPLESARVLIRGREDPNTPTNLIRTRFTMISVFDSTGKRICTTTAQPGIANGAWSNSVDLLTGSCATPRGGNTPDPRYPDGSGPNKADIFGTWNNNYYRPEAKLTDEGQLSGWLEITEYMTMLAPIITQQATIDDVQVITNSDDQGVVVDDVQPGEAAGTWSPAAGASGHDLRAVPTMRSGCEHLLICEVNAPGRRPTQPFVHEMVLDGLDIGIPPEYAAEDIDPHVQGLRAVVGIDPLFCPDNPDGSNQCSFGNAGIDEFIKDPYFGKEVTFRLELESDGGKRCSKIGGYVSFTQEIAFDLSSNSPVPTGEDDCAAVFDHYGDLGCADASDPGPCTRLRLRVEMPCIRNWFGPYWDCVTNGPNVFQVRPPAVRSVRLELETDSYLGPRPTSVVNVKATTTDVGSSFNVKGKVWMPRATMDVFWRGDVTEGRPLVSDELVLGALGSQITGPLTRLSDPAYSAADRYLVCCEPRESPTRHVRLTARIGDRSLQAEILFTDVAPTEGGGSEYEPGYKVEILSWQTCDKGRCDSG